MHITLCDIYISTRVALLATDAQKETFVYGISDVLNNTYSASVFVVWSFVGLFFHLVFAKAVAAVLSLP